MFGSDISRNVAAGFNKKHSDTPVIYSAITRLTPHYAFNVPGLQIHRVRTYITRRWSELLWNTINGLAHYMIINL